MYWEVSVWMLITLQSYNRLIPKNCESRHFDVEAEAFSTFPISHWWERECCSILFHCSRGGTSGTSGTSGTGGTSGTDGTKLSWECENSVKESKYCVISEKNVYIWNSFAKCRPAEGLGRGGWLQFCCSRTGVHRAWADARLRIHLTRNRDIWRDVDN